MGFLDRLFSNDHERAATQYAGRESASDRAARKRRENHRRKGVQRAARAGEHWEEQDRRRFR
ncbi:hypothetical protein ACWDA7_44135 [Streptomyces sp. NPDC001156]